MTGEGTMEKITTQIGEEQLEMDDIPRMVRREEGVNRVMRRVDDRRSMRVAA